MPYSFQQLATCIHKAALDGTNRGTHRRVSLYINNSSSSDIDIIINNITTTVAATAPTTAK
jgi:hypothetical protein